ncbi:MAG: tetratricopeptide repeat protein, partial [Calditrichaeota bacterium]
ASYNYSQALTGGEFLCRSIAAIQKSAQRLYDDSASSRARGESYLSSDGRTVFHFQQKVSEMLPVINFNTEAGDKKTRLLNDFILLYPQLTEREDKLRYWQAVERIFIELELSRSQSGYAMFQRNAEGLLTKPDHMVNQLLSFADREQDADVQTSAQTVCRQVVKDLKKPLSADDQELIDLVERNREFMQALKLDSLARVHHPRQEISSWMRKGLSAADPAEQISAYSQVLAIDSSNVVALNNRGSAYQQLGQYDQAVSDYLRVVAVDSNHSAAWFNLGMVYRLMGNVGRALTALDKAIDLNPNLSQAFFLRASILYQQNDLNQAVENYTRALEINPHNATFWNNRALAWKSQRKFDDALDDLRKAISLTPDDPKIWYNLGCIHWERHDWKAAGEAWEKCLALNPAHENAVKWLALVREQLLKKKR